MTLTAILLHPAIRFFWGGRRSTLGSKSSGNKEDLSLGAVTSAKGLQSGELGYQWG
jgi:hypothetical protein